MQEQAGHLQRVENLAEDGRAGVTKGQTLSVQISLQHVCMSLNLGEGEN